MFRDMKKASEDGAIGIGETSVAIVDADGNYRDFADILADTEEATKGMTVAQRDAALGAVFGEQAIKGVNMVMEAGTGTLIEFEEELRNSDGAASDMYDTMQDNLKGAFDNLKSAVEEAGISLSETLIPMVEKVVGKIQEWVDKFNALDDETKEVIVKVGLLVAAIGPVLLILSKILNPIGLVITAITAMAGGIIYLRETNEEFKEATDRIWEAIKSTITTVIGIIEGVIDVFIGLFTGDWTRMGEGIKKIWTGMWNGIKTIVEGAWGLLSTAFSSLWTSISGWFTGLVNDAKEWGSNFISGLWQGIKDAKDDLMTKIRGFGTSISNTFKSVLRISSPSKVFAEHGENIVAGLVEGIDNNASSAEASVKSMADKVVNVYEKTTTASLERQIAALKQKTIDENAELKKQEYNAKVSNAEKLIEEERSNYKLQKAKAKSKEDKRKLETEHKTKMAKLQDDLKKMLDEKAREIVLSERDIKLKGYEQELADRKKHHEEMIKTLDTMKSDFVKKYNDLEDAVMKALKEKWSKQEEAQLKSLEKQTQQVKDQIDKRILEYNREFDAKMRVLTAETSEEMKKYQDKIDLINAQTKKEEKELKEREFQEKQSNRKKELQQYDSNGKVIKAHNDRNAAIEERDNAMIALQNSNVDLATQFEQEGLIKQTYNNKVAYIDRELLQEEHSEEALEIYDALNEDEEEKQKEREEGYRDIQILGLEEEMDRVQDQHDDKEIEYKKDRDNKIKIQEDMLDDVEEHYKKEKEALIIHYGELMDAEAIQAEARALILDGDNEDMIKLLKTYNPKWFDSGKTFGEQLLAGLRATKSSIQAEINEILSMVDRVGNASPSGGGGSPSKLDDNQANRNLLTYKENYGIFEKKGDKKGMAAMKKAADDLREEIGDDTTASMSADELRKALGQNALGTNFWKGGYTWVGEKGPEIIEAPRGSRIHSNSKSMEMAKGTTIQNLNITIPAKDIREFKDVTEFFAKLPQTVKAGVVYG